MTSKTSNRADSPNQRRTMKNHLLLLALVLSTTNRKRRRQSHPWWRTTLLRTSSLVSVLLIFACKAFGDPYIPFPFGTNDWPWSNNLSAAACTYPPGTYVISNGVFDTTLLTAPSSIGG